VIFFEEKALKVLGGKIDSPDVIDFMGNLKEAPSTEEDFLGFPDDSIFYFFQKSGITLIFRKSNDLLTAVSFCFFPTKKMEKFDGVFNFFLNEFATKLSILEKLGAPSRENNIVDNSYGVLTPRWICYDYDKYTLRCAFHGDDDRLAEVNLMTPEEAPGRIS